MQNPKSLVEYTDRKSKQATELYRELIIRACKSTKRVLFVREVQINIKNSLYPLIKEQIDAMSIAHKFFFTASEIINVHNGSRFIFCGARDTAKIKSLGKVDICYIDEADKITGSGRDALYSAICRFNPELWIIYNSNGNTTANIDVEGDINPFQWCHDIEYEKGADEARDEAGRI